MIGVFCQYFNLEVAWDYCYKDVLWGMCRLAVLEFTLYLRSTICKCKKVVLKYCICMRWYALLAF